MDMVNWMENACSEVFIDEDFYLYLTIDGTEVENIKVKISNPWNTLREQTNRIISAFHLPRVDNGGNPVQYLLGGYINGEEEPEIFEFENEDGKEQTLIDYGLKPGSHIHLLSVPVAGTNRAYLYYIKTKSFWKFNIQLLREYGGYPGFPTSSYTKNIIEWACRDFNLDDSKEYYICKIARIGFDDIALKYLAPFDSSHNKTFLDDYFKPEDWFFIDKPVLIILPKGLNISKRIYNQLKKAYNGKRRNVRR